jgi:hypothetical protein
MSCFLLEYVGQQYKASLLPAYDNQLALDESRCHRFILQTQSQEGLLLYQADSLPSASVAFYHP